MTEHHTTGDDETPTTPDLGVTGTDPAEDPATSAEAPTLALPTESTSATAPSSAEAPTLALSTEPAATEILPAGPGPSVPVAPEPTLALPTEPAATAFPAADPAASAGWPGAETPAGAAAPAAAPLLGGVGTLPVDPTPPAPTTPTAVDPQAPWAPPPARGPRIGTVLWGFVILVVAATILAVALGRTVDFGLVAIGVLGLAGATLVVASIVSSARRRGRG